MVNKKDYQELKHQLDLIMDFLHTKEMYLEFIHWKSRHEKGKSKQSPSYPYPECGGKILDIDFCIEKDCKHLQSEQRHQIQYCSLSLWKAEEKYGW